MFDDILDCKLNIANNFDYFSRREFVKIKFFESVIIGIYYLPGYIMVV